MDISEYTPVGKKDCQGICDRKILATNIGTIVICNGCYRIVMDNRIKNKYKKF
jgi:hypothetical protein